MDKEQNHIKLSSLQLELFEMLKQNTRKTFTPEYLNTITNYSVKQIKYNLNLMVKKDIGILEASKCLPSGYVYSIGYYYLEN